MSTQSERFNCMKSQRDEARARVKELEASLIFEIDDGMGSRVGLEGDPDLARLIEIVWPLHEVGGSIIGCAINRIEKGQRDAKRVRELEAVNEAISEQMIAQSAEAGELSTATGLVLGLKTKVSHLQSLLTPRRIDEDTPDGVLVWMYDSWGKAHRGATGRWVQSSTNLYHDEQPTWWIPMLPAPEEEP